MVKLWGESLPDQVNRDKADYSKLGDCKEALETVFTDWPRSKWKICYGGIPIVSTSISDLSKNDCQRTSPQGGRKPGNSLHQRLL